MLANTVLVPANVNRVPSMFPSVPAASGSKLCHAGRGAFWCEPTQFEASSFQLRNGDPWSNDRGKYRWLVLGAALRAETTPFQSH